MNAMRLIIPTMLSCLVLLPMHPSRAEPAASDLRVPILASDSMQSVPRRTATFNSAAVFAAELTRRRIAIFNSHGERIGSIETAIGIMATDPLGNLYVSVVNEYAESIKIYAPPYTGKPQLVNLPGQLVGGVAVDQNTGVFAVMSQAASQGGGASQMNFYRHGETKACKVIREPVGVTGFGNFLAFDREGNLFFAIDKSGSLHMASIGGQCSADTITNYSSEISGFGNLAFNSNDELVVQQYAGQNSYPVYTYMHPRGGALGTPIATTVLTAVNGYVPGFEALPSDGKHLLADFATQSLGVYDYPKGGSPVRAIHAYNVIYSAVFPTVDP